MWFEIFTTVLTISEKLITNRVDMVDITLVNTLNALKSKFFQHLLDQVFAIYKYAY